MTCVRLTTLLLGSLCLGMAPCVPAAGNRTATAMLGNDLFMAGSEARASNGSAGDAMLAGGWISTAGTVHGDEVATGGRVTLDADVDGGVYAAGGHVRLEGRIGRNARLAGGEVEVGPQADVQGGVSVAAGEVTVSGRVGKYLQVGAGRTRIDGEIGGNVDVASGQLTLGPHAVIDGALTYYGPQPALIESGAQVRGETHYIERKSWRRAGVHRRFGAAAWIGLIGWIIAGAVLIALWPSLARQVGEVTRRNPGIVLLLGFAVLVCVPVALIVLCISIVGIPLALLLLLAYLLLLAVGYLAAAAAIGEWLLARARGSTPLRTGPRILMLIVVLVVLFLLARIPVLGGVVRFLLMLAGIGSLVMTAAQRQRGETAAATTT
jgi:hypothetical protein